MNFSRVLAHVGDPDRGRQPVAQLPRPEHGAAHQHVAAAALDVAHHDHRARHGADVVGVQRQLVPHARDVGEVLAHALVAAVGPGARDVAGGAVEMQLAVGRGDRHQPVDVARGERGVATPDDGDVWSSARRGCRSTRGAPRRRV